uniref:Protein RRP5 homolog n=1 Tax=Mastacembelus armatus TaxID=205130 RepID=A0A7N8XWV8_9TELE
MASVDEDFPRGGGTAKKPTESKIVVQRTEVDNLFQVEFSAFFFFSILMTEQRFYLTLWEGMLMLGCVKEVTDFEVMVGLPCGLQGFLSIRNISDSYTRLLSEQLGSETEEICSLPHLFHPGMVLRCAVAKLDITKGGALSIQLSINPKLVNKALTSNSLKPGMVLSGCVESLEDHGCIVDIGISGSKAFLPKKASKDNQNNTDELKVGQFVISQVEEVKNDGRVVRLSVNPQTIAQACAEVEQGWNLTNLLPGLLVKSTIKKVTTHGLILEFLSSFCGQVDFLHMEPGQVQACVLYIDLSIRLVGLSLRSYFIKPGTRVDPTPAGGDRIGEVVKDCKMIAMHHMSGAMLELPGKTLAYNRLLAIPEHTCRILDFSPMDQIHLVSLRRSVIEKPFFRYHDLQAGQVVEGTVSVLLNHGMVVHLSDHIKGLVPRTHLSDIILKNPEKKYTEGMKVKCRVLSVDAENKKLYLTRKKAMVESSLPLLLSFSDAHPGCVSHGYIVCIKDFGCIVRFYNNVKGLVPLSELSSEPVVSPEEVFYVGQVLKTKVLQCDPKKAKMVLSFRAAIEGEKEQVAKPQLEARVLKKSVNGLEVAILPDEIRAVLPTMHLSDHMSNCPLLWESLQEGDNIKSLSVFLSCSSFKNLTKKPTVRWSLEEGVVAKDFSELTVGMQLIGWIKNIMSYGVFVEFPYGLIGLAPKSAMTDKFLSDANTAFQLGQTVIAKVTNLDEEKHRFLITLKISERRAVTEMLALRGMHGLRLLVSNNICSSYELLPHSGVNLTSGQKVTAVILHVDILSSCVHVSILPKLVAKKKSLIEGSKYTAMVQYIDKDFAVISLDDTAQLTIIQTSCHLNEMVLSEPEMLKAGMCLAVDVIELSCQELQGLPLVSWTRTTPKRQRTTSENQAGSKGHCFGEILQGKVRTVKPTCIQVTLEDGSTGSVHVSEVVEVAEVCQGSFPTSSVKVGSVVTARVIGGREASSHRFLPFSHPKFTYTIPELTLIPRYYTVYSMNVISKIPKCTVFSFSAATWTAVFHTMYRDDKFDITSFIYRSLKKKKKKFKNRTQLNSFLGSRSFPGVHKLDKGTITLGMVTNVQPQLGLLVKLPFGGMGSVAVTDLADAYRPNPLDGYSKDQLLRCFLLESQQGKWQLSLRPSRLNPEQAKPVKDPDVLSVDKLKTGQIIRGYVKSVGEQGYVIVLFVCQKQAESQVSKKKKKKIKKGKTDDSDSGVEVYFREEEEDNEDGEPKPEIFVFFSSQQVTPNSAAPSRLQVAAGFSWDMGLSSLKPASAARDGDSSDGEDQDGSSKPQKKSRHELEQEKKAAEKALVQREAELMDPNLRPQDAAAFERLLLASPNSSLLWLQYIAHHLQATQIEQARAVAERALKTISFREEQEKLNVWVALLNLENMYGTVESLKKVFERALQFCEPMPVYQHLADIYAKSNKTKEADALYKTIVKRFRHNKEVWLSYGSFLLQQGQSDAASAVLQRALTSLPAKESVDVIAKFAQLEFRYGDAEKGRVMFDKVLTSYPKRTDLWSVFIDLMIKHGSQKEVRTLFDRVIHLTVSVKKVKFFFKRYLEYEKKHGTPQSIQEVKEKAMEFVEAKGTEAAN